MPADFIGFGYAMTVAAGGVIGYVKSANSGTLMCMMGYRFFNSGKFMPAGLIAALSLLMVMKSGYKMMSQ
ncbi:TM14C-like protein [Mya arenaria]|uniref:TM14C-like protein n=1 Tax=Mya arenaria TaxID=6604 RepID=A0ABY7FX19_MYAAR|nr:TM14C-like protein [Mya arenaria]